MSEPVYIVAGVPRSGLTLTTQMLVAAGIPSIFNTPWPYEHGIEMSALSGQWGWLPSARGCVVKLPNAIDLSGIAGHGRVFVIVTSRDERDVAKSSRRFFGAMTGMDFAMPPKQYRADIREIRKSAGRHATAMLHMPFAELVERPRAAAERLSAFVGRGDPEAMAARARPRSAALYPTLLELEMVA